MKPMFKLGEGKKAVEMVGYKISYSRASSYLSCPQAHHFSYIQNLRPKGIVRPLHFGGDFHKLLELRNNPKKLYKAWDKIRDVYDELGTKAQSDLGDNYISDLETVFSDYLFIWEDSEKPVVTEHEFLIKIGNLKGYPVYFHGKIDEIYDDGSIGEHKTFNIQPDMSILAMNMQSVLYAKARELETGEKPDRVRWDYIKSSPAKSPIWLDKSGRFSEATNSQITDLSWLRACEERGITDPDILNKADMYKPNRTNFYFRVSTNIVPQMVDTAWRDFKSVCKDIVLKGDTNRVKNISRDCSWCSYRPICYAEFTGADVEYVKNTDYEIRER